MSIVSGKRVLVTLLAAVTLLFTISGCGGGSSSSGSGTLTPKSWGTAELIETRDTGDAAYPQIAFDAAGNAIAVWHQFDGIISLDVWANRFDGVDWNTAELIETDIGMAGEAQIAVDAAGKAIAVWTQYDGVHINIWANRFDGTTWDTAELIETTIGDAREPQIAMDGAGNAIAVWAQDDGTRFNIWTNRFDGANWGTAELIETVAGDAWSHLIAMDVTGNAIAIWKQHDGTRWNIWANRFNGVAWGTVTLIENNDSDLGEWRGQIAMDGAGNAIAVWDQWDGARSNIWANRFDGATWGTAELIETDDAGSAAYPQIAFDYAGNAIAVWHQFDGIRYSIWANRFDGVGWNTAERIETADGHSAGIQIAMDGAGNAIAVWQQSDGVHYNIWATHFDGTDWDTAELIETAAGDAVEPQIAMDDAGNAIAVWQQNDGVSDNIWANRFE